MLELNPLGQDEITGEQLRAEQYQDSRAIRLI